MLNKIQFLALFTVLNLPSAYFAWCGDGFIDAGETCDLGLNNNDNPDTSGCSTQCTVNPGKWTCTKDQAGYTEAQNNLGALFQKLVPQNQQDGYKQCGSAPNSTTGTAVYQHVDCNQFIADTVKFIDLNKNTGFNTEDFNACTGLQSTDNTKLTIVSFDPKTSVQNGTYTIQCK